MKSHFKFSKQKRSGIFLLVLLIVIAQYVYFFVDFSSEDIDSLTDEELEIYRSEIDSLRQVAIKNSVPKTYPFNPNYITDYKGYTLGMSNEEIDRLHQFRSKNQWVNSAKEFQEVTKASDSLLAKISPYFKFPDWVTNSKPKTYSNSYSNTNKVKTYAQKQDLNKATASKLQKVYGIGEKLSERIIAYREKYNGFVSEVELTQIWGLTPEVIERINQQFIVKTPRAIKSFNLNTATRDQLVTIPHIDYEIANSIIEERILRDGFKTIDDLTKVEYFPLKKLDIIRLYLQL
ncbi:MAG: helix-hairpin-helix domain-containing protein [Winogradskyella sp.]|uniref:ComEA family DNA-binding protein n=1 Tax=Winogradskyella sp. TaxID=1883156 RepID=UPI0018460C75|nr:helix-hairpin-helix domain-containing protein [Winogradskyella sp.]MBT8243724.1 helix-hairpin-helix domain-containing protein [Winogradskyella sp.]NNK22082.1 helix-hairpin-helix domain-containing protein [Winogradskyella sp.]